MKVEKITNKGYFLGTKEDGSKVYLTKPSWDCNWYWGFGYVETYNGKGRPILYSHEHWNSLVPDMNSYDAFKHIIKKPTISEEQLWLLCDFMKSFYTLQEMAELVHRGGSNYTEKAHKLVNLKNETLENSINKELLPALFEQIEQLFK